MLENLKGEIVFKSVEDLNKTIKILKNENILFFDKDKKVLKWEDENSKKSRTVIIENKLVIPNLLGDNYSNFLKYIDKETIESILIRVSFDSSFVGVFYFDKEIKLIKTSSTKLFNCKGPSIIEKLEKFVDTEDKEVINNILNNNK